MAAAETERIRLQRGCPTLEDLATRYLDAGAREDPHTNREAWKHSYAENTRRYVSRFVRELGPDRRVDDVTHDERVRFLGELVPMRNGAPTGAVPTRKFLSNYALPIKGMFAPARARRSYPGPARRG